MYTEILYHQILQMSKKIEKIIELFFNLWYNYMNSFNFLCFGGAL